MLRSSLCNFNHKYWAFTILTCLILTLKILIKTLRENLTIR